MLAGNRNRKRNDYVNEIAKQCMYCILIYTSAGKCLQSLKMVYTVTIRQRRVLAQQLSCVTAQEKEYLIFTAAKALTTQWPALFPFADKT
jgi:hypothetical protein